MLREHKLAYISHFGIENEPPEFEVMTQPLRIVDLTNQTSNDNNDLSLLRNDHLQANNSLTITKIHKSLKEMSNKVEQFNETTKKNFEKRLWVKI